MKKFVFLFLFMCSGANSAQLVGNEITLCTNGYSADGSTCTPYDVGNCDSGYYDMNIASTEFISQTLYSCTYNGYTKTTLPDTNIVIKYSGASIGDEITLCSNGYSADGSTCTTYDMGDCDTGYYEIVTNSTSFVSTTKNHQCIYTNYKSKLMPDNIIALYYHGAVLGDEITLCTNGYSADGSTCTDYIQSTDCPNNYYNVNPSATAFTLKTGSCASGYSQYTAEESCGFEPSKSTCVSLCENGLLTTSVGGCSSLCSLGVTTLRTGNGVILPMWTTKQTTPSINIGVQGGTCYVNLTESPVSEMTIHVNYDDKTYHAIK